MHLPASFGFTLSVLLRVLPVQDHIQDTFTGDNRLLFGYGSVCTVTALQQDTFTSPLTGDRFHMWRSAGVVAVRMVCGGM